MNLMAETVFLKTEIIFTLSVFVIMLLILLFYINETRKKRIKLDAHYNRFSKLFENSNDAIVITNQLSEILSVNRVATEKFNIKSESSKQSIFSLFPKGSQRKIYDELALTNTNVKDLRINLLNQDSSVLAVSISITQWKEEDKAFYGYIFSDISAELQVEKEQKIINSIYKSSNNDISQNKFLRKVLLSICEEYGFKFGELWINNKYDSQLITNDLESDEENEIKVFHNDQIQSELLNKLLFQESTYKVRKFSDINKTEYPRIELRQDQDFTYVVSLPVLFNQRIPLAFLLYSHEEHLNVELVDSLFMIVNVIGEINQRKIISSELKDKLLLLDEAEELSQSGNWEWNLETGMVNFSEGYKRIYNQKNYTSHESHLFDTILDEDLEKTQAIINEAIERKTKFFLEYRIKSKDLIKFVHTRGIPKIDFNGKLVSYFGSVIDVTMLKEQQEELENVNNELISVNENLEQFTYIASHDLQEPLRKIRTFGKLLSGKYEEGAPGFEYVQRMQNAAERMQTLIKDLLDFSRVSRTVDVEDKIEFNDLIKSILDDLKHNKNSENCKFEVGILPEFYKGNSTQMRQLFQNLISNAIKYNDKSKECIIKINGEEVNSSDFSFLNKEIKRFHKIIVKDNGLGFDAKYKEKIFEMFQRLHAKNEYEGTGIGLAICKKIVENHEGIIEVSSILEEGSTFTIFLPIE